MSNCCGHEPAPKKAQDSCCNSTATSPECGLKSAVFNPVKLTKPQVRQIALKIEAMDCLTEERLIRQKLKALNGISSLDFDLSNRTLLVGHTLSSETPIIEAIKSLHMQAEPLERSKHPTSCCAPKPNPVAAVSCCGGSTIKTAHTHTTPSASQGGQLSIFKIEQMDCPTEEGLIRNKLEGMAGVQSLEFNLLKRTLGVRHLLPSEEPIKKAISSLGMKAEPVNDTTRTRIRIMQMDCPTEEKLIRDKLSRMEGILGLDFNLIQRVLTVHHDPEVLTPMLDNIRGLGFTPELEADTAQQTASLPAAKKWWPLALGGVSALGAELLHFTQAAPEWLVAALALVAVLASGLSTYKKGWIALRNRNLNINALMSIAVTGALLIGQWPEAAMVMVLFAIAELIEAKSIDRARNAIKGLMQLTPDQATVLQAGGHWVEKAVNDVRVGDRIRVKPGERVGLDGIIEQGSSSVNQAPITGESLPVEKAPGDMLFAGTINQEGALEFRVTAPASQSTLARIIHAVEEAQGNKAPTQRFVDQFSRIYTPGVFLFALAVAVLPPLVMGGEWFAWIYRALVLLVVACPCALVISTPVTIVSGLAAAARKGILIKGGLYLETGSKLTHLAFDKTGTLTHGRPEQTDFFPVEMQVSPDVYASVAASLANRSDHPVSKAIANASLRKGISIQEVDHFEALAGRGIRGQIGRHIYLLGNYRLAEERKLVSDWLKSKTQELERQGKTVVMLMDESRVFALFAVADTVKPSSREAISALQTLGIKSLALTGDNPYTAQAIASQVGIDQVRGNQLPDDKLSAVKELQQKGYIVGMVGDGINDAPALAQADIGLAMGAAGTDTAIETADVALMDDDLRKAADFIRLSRQAATVLKQNIGLAIGIKAIFLIFTLTGHATMWMAVFADMGVSLLVVFNGLRLLRQ